MHAEHEEIYSKALITRGDVSLKLAAGAMPHNFSTSRFWHLEVEPAHWFLLQSSLGLFHFYSVINPEFC